MFNYVLYRIGQFIAMHLPLNAAYAVAVFFSDLRYLFAFEDNKNVKANLKCIFPDKSAREISSIRIRMNRNFAKYLVDFFRFQAIDKEYIKKYVRVENRHFLDEALALGKGGIILTAHLGNWELGGVVIAQLGYPLWAVALPHKSKKVNDFFNFQRESKGMHVIPLGKAFIKCLNLLKENELIALVGDRDFTNDSGIRMNFFGKPAYIPKGPAIISLITGAPIIPAFMIRTENEGVFALQFGKPLIFQPAGETSIRSGNASRLKRIRDEELKRVTESCLEIIEEYIKKLPDQWYMFRKFWIE